MLRCGAFCFWRNCRVLYEFVVVRETLLSLKGHWFRRWPDPFMSAHAPVEADVGAAMTESILGVGLVVGLAFFYLFYRAGNFG